MLAENLRAATVVVIDDMAPNLRLLESSLRAFGLRHVHGFTSSAAGLEFLQHQHWDLLLLDLDMPPPNGFDILQQLGRDERAPVIIVTALSSATDRRRGLELGANDYICKPLDLPEVLLRIRNNLQLSLANQALQRERDKLDQQVQKRTHQLRESFQALIHSLARAATFKDNETGNHILRIGAMAALIARHIGQPDSWVDTIGMAAPMHDVGKIGIPDAILHKPGRLDPHERDVMNRHARLGYDILCDKCHDPLINMAAAIALCHHEHWDGSGYPQGLSGPAIPLAARIVALCDVYDALRSTRPYKQAWSAEQTQQHIQREAGRQFDPELVAAMVRLFPQIEALLLQMADTQIEAGADS